MALTDVAKTQALVWVQCPVEGFTDERHLLMPYTHSVQRDIVDLSRPAEMVKGVIQRQFDEGLFEPNYIKVVWKGWEGPGIVHLDGRVEDPAAYSEENKAILMDCRPPTFFAWMQQAAQALALAAHTQLVQERANFRQAHDVPAPLQGAELPGMPDAS